MIKSGNIIVIYYRTACWLSVEGIVCDFKYPAINFTAHNLPVCSFKEFRIAFTESVVDSSCAGFLAVIETLPEGGNMQPIPGVSCCKDAVLTPDSAIWLAYSGDLEIYVYLATRTN